MKAAVTDVGPVVVNVYASDNRGTKSGRPQRYRWRAVAANHKKLAAGEAYANEGDCTNTVRLLFKGTGHTLRREGHEDEIL